MEKPSYYAILPANVRYDSNITQFAKLLYAELTALSNKHGYCWANNTYFAQLYETTPRTVQRALNDLEKNNYICKEISEDKRRIFCIGATNLSIPHDKNVVPLHDKNVIHNNIKDNNKKEYIYDRNLEDFGKFWKALNGRKVAKPSALKAYLKIDTDLSAEELAQKYNELLSSRDEKFCPYPQKWLNNEGWNDQVNQKVQTHAFVSEEKIYRDEDGYIISKEEYERSKK
tara:strand:- start:1066 stop:1752 length:687 start_codon:yes stop_codon:yes gene_type:complete